MEIKIQMFKCKCGKARLLRVIDDNPLSKEDKKEQLALLNAGCEVSIISLDEARNAELCFDCKL
jgi:hypothetical protein